MPRPIPIALFVVIGLNAALLLFVVSPSRSADHDPSAASAGHSTHPAGPPRIDGKTWDSLRTEHLPDLVARLREAGFPKDVVRSLVTAVLSEQYAARRKALNGADTQPFWKHSVGADPAVRRALAQLTKEQQQTLENLLGRDARVDDPMAVASTKASFGPLSPDKFDAVERLMREHDSKVGDLYTTRGAMSQDDRAALDQQLRASLAQILTPAELEDYDLRSSPTGSSLRSQLAAFEPTEDEFRLIYKLRQPFDEQYGAEYRMVSSEKNRERAEAELRLNDEIKTALGPTRGEEYIRDTDSDYQETSHLVTRLELPPQTTTNLWKTAQEFEQRRDEIMSHPAADPAQRTQQLTTLQQEATARVAILLGGANRVGTYVEYGGSWLQDLLPRPEPPPKP